MKSFTPFQIATGAAFLSLATLIKGQSMCAISCFQTVITEHPPLDCTEENMYLCFCKMPSLQNYFIDCAYSECASDAEAVINFGVNICEEYGAPITVPPRSSSTAVAEVETSAPSEPSSVPAPTTSSAVEEVSAVSSVEQQSTLTSVASAPSTTPIASVTSGVASPTGGANVTSTPPVVTPNLGASSKATGLSGVIGAALVAIFL